MPEIVAQSIVPMIGALKTPTGAASGLLGVLLGLVQMWRMRRSRKTAGDWLLHLVMAGIAAACAAVVVYRMSALPWSALVPAASPGVELAGIVDWMLTPTGLVSTVFGIVMGGLTYWSIGGGRRTAMDGIIRVVVSIMAVIALAFTAGKAIPGPLPFLETVISGLLTGVMYALVALGFVLIYKASGVFNFAQGVMALFAGLTLVGLMTGTIPFLNRQNPSLALPVWAAIPATIVVMILVAMLIEKFVLRHLVNQDHIILFMATLGLAYILEGAGDTIWGSDVKKVDVGLPDGAIDWLFDRGLMIEKLEVAAAVIATSLVVVLAVFFQKTRIGRALRAVADDHQAALSVGISLQTIWVIVWSVAGIVALVAGVMWGAKSGIQFSLSQIALKALPVLILGGFESIPGAIIGGLIIGVGEKVAEVYFGPLVGGAVENWFAYMLALVFLLFRPQGLFGEKIIERI